MKPLTDHNLIARGLAALARLVLRYPRWIVYSQAVLFVCCVLYTIKYLEFDTRREHLVGPDKKYHQIYLEFKKEFPSQDDLVVVVESEHPEKNRQFVERLGARLEQEPHLFVDLFYKGDLKMLGNKALLFVPEADLKELETRLGSYLPFVEQFTRATNLVSLFSLVNRQFRTAKRETNAENTSLISALPALERLIRQATDSLHRPGTPPSPGVTALFDPSGQASRGMYYSFAGGRIFIVSAQAPRQDLNAAAIARLRELVEQTRTEVPGLNVGITGEPILELDEMAQSQVDTSLASVAALAICALIFIYGYQETGRPMKAMGCLVVGLAYTLAFAAATIGHLNILTITFVPMLIGLAIDYGVHLISRYEEELRRGAPEEAALMKAMVFTGQGIFTGAFTTAGAFLAMSFTNFKGIQEMGVICGGGLLICLIPMMTVLPVLLLRGRQNVIDHEQCDRLSHRARLENIWLRRPIQVTVVTAGISLLCATQLDKVYFDYNLLHMQSASLPSVVFEKKLLAAASVASDTNGQTRSLLYAAVVATNLQHALLLEQQITNLPAVAGVESITPFLTEDQSRKLRIVQDIKRRLAPLEFGEYDSDPIDVPELSRTLYSLYGYLGAGADASREEAPELSERLLSMRGAVEQFRVELLRGDTAQRERSEARLAAFQRALFGDVQQTFSAMQTQDTRAPLRVQDLPRTLQNRFIGVTGKYLIMVYPKKDVWDRENQHEFISQLREVYPQVTGTPVQLYEYTNLLRRSYEEAARYSLAAIAILILIHFRSLVSLVLALIPVVLGAVWLGGFMGYFNVPFNPANIMTLPLVIGIGVTNGIHILNRFAEEQHPSILARSTGKAVLVSGLTTIAGFGSLILAEHQGIQSLGYVMSVGLASCMIVGLTFLPALLNLVLYLRDRKARPSQDSP